MQRRHTSLLEKYRHAGQAVHTIVPGYPAVAPEARAKKTIFRTESDLRLIALGT